MFKINFKNILVNFIIVLIIFLADRISKMYILKLVELENTVDIYLTPYLNLYLIWNKGIAFGLFSFDNNYIYNLISSIIIAITIVILIMIVKSNGFKKYCLMSIFGGSIGNLFDRIYFAAVPDFIDLHINNYHWFIFNIADIFITIGVLCLIYVELITNIKKNEKFN
jgi:signal peptidase II